MIYGYIRVSSSTQADSGLSLQDQRRVITQRAGMLTEGGVEIFEDAAVSASRIALRCRPAGSKLDAILMRGDAVIFAKLDRGFRNMADCVVTMTEWETRGVVVHLLDLGVDTSTPSGQLMVGIMASFAQFESKRIGERTKCAKASMRANGQSTNGVRRLGYAIVDGILVPHPVERAIASRVSEMRREGLWWRQISERLNEEGVERPGGFNQTITEWTPQAVSRLEKAFASRWP